MRLIACAQCHAQYDVACVAAETIACSCGETLENRALTPVDNPVQRCGACGALVVADADTHDCQYCGSTLTPTGDLSLICPECFARNEDEARFCTACGVAFSPQAIPIDGHELPCPACDLLMPPTQVAGIGLNECVSCSGLWVPGENFDALVERATENARAAGSSAPRSQGGNPARRQVQYRKCPECQGFMQRRNYRRSSGVVLDVCHEHGSWLDADELEEIAGFILSGGQTSAMLEEEHKTTSHGGATAKASLARMRAAQEMQQHHGWGRPTPGTGSGSLLRLLTDLFS
jgi:Zn-finger nucleic acid-binding protein